MALASYAPHNKKTVSIFGTKKITRRDPSPVIQPMKIADRVLDQ